MTIPLLPEEITERVEALRTSLTTMQIARLMTIRDLIGDDGRFQLRAALEEGDFPRGDTRAQDAFQDFRQKVNARADEAGVDLELVLDSRKTSPDDRYGWFTGDPVRKSLVAYTEGASERAGDERAVAPEVAELGASRRLRVYVSFHPTTGALARKPAALIEQLRTALAVSAEYEFEVCDPRSAGVGEDATKARDRLCAEADVRVALISPDYLVHPDERRRVLDTAGRVVAFALSALPSDPVDLRPLRRHDIEQLGRPWDQLTRPGQRAEYIDEVRRQIMRALSRPASGEGAEDDKTVLLEWTARGLHDDVGHLVPAELAEASLQESHLDQAATASTPPLRAVDRLVDWATDGKPGAPRLCALLGDVGMGKTTTAKLFTQRLLELYRRDSTLPLPLLFDLRDVRVTGLTASMTLDHILDSMLDSTRPAGVSGKRLNANVVRKQLEHGRTVIVFDGLDEVLVHLSPHDRQLFTRQLWRAVTERSSARMLLTCRTQYFRTIRDEVTYFTGETRQGLRGGDYLALLMLPFRDEQVREYLAGNVDRDGDWVDQFLETIAAVHDLPDLTRRPITLRLIADQVEFIETAKLEGRTLRSVDIYSEVVDRWISRDEGKHTLTPDHKRLLMEEIAAGLWRSGQNAWSPNEVDDWLLDLLDQRPDLRRHYRDHVPDLWTADFRTATFLKREGDTFQFSHRSLFEYFLARYLLRVLNVGQLENLAMSVPSRETLDFLGQSIAAEIEEGRTSALRTLRNIGMEYRFQASELAFAYALSAHRNGHPCQSLVGIRLVGADLAEWDIVSGDRVLSMNGADFTAANLRHAVFRNIDLAGAVFADADVSSAEFHGSTLRMSSWRDARAVGTVFRRCDIEGGNLVEARTYRAQLLLCKSSTPPDPGFLVAPSEMIDAWSSVDVRLRHFTGHTSVVKAVAWSPDGSRILTGGGDSVRIWNTATGEILCYLPERAGRVRAAAWSPDGAFVLTAGNGVRVWDVVAGEVLRMIGDRSDSFTSVAWSPDGSRVLAGGDGVRVWDVVTGEVLHSLSGRGDDVWTVAWSPECRRVLIGGDRGGLRIWDVVEDEVVSLVSAQDSAVDSVAWSPDGAQVFAGSRGGGGVFLDVATGEISSRFSGSFDSESSAAWSPDGSRIFTGGNVEKIRDSATGKVLCRLPAAACWVLSVAWTPDGGSVVVGGNNRSVRIWNVDTGSVARILVGPLVLTAPGAWSPDRDRVLLGGSRGVEVWDVGAGLSVRQFDKSASVVAWSPDGSCVIASVDGGVEVWDVDTGSSVCRFGGAFDLVEAMAFSPDGSRAVISSDGGLGVWDVTTGELVRQFTTSDGFVLEVAWSPDSCKIVVGGRDRSAQIWDVTTGEIIQHLIGHADSVRTVAWSPEGTRVVTGSQDGSALIWDAATGEIVAHLNCHTDWVRTVAWSPDGSRIVTGGDDGSAQIWDAVTGEASGLTLALFDQGDVAIYHPATNTVIGCTEGAWRWLGWNVRTAEGIDRMPAETFGELPPLAGRFRD